MQIGGAGEIVGSPDVASKQKGADYWRGGAYGGSRRCRPLEGKRKRVKVGGQRRSAEAVARAQAKKWHGRGKLSYL